MVARTRLDQRWKEQALTKFSKNFWKISAMASVFEKHSLSDKHDAAASANCDWLSFLNTADAACIAKHREDLVAMTMAHHTLH